VPKERVSELGPPEPQDEWVDEGRVSGGRQASPPPKRRNVRPTKVHVPELEALVGKQRARRLEERIGDAATAFAAERYIDARRTLKPIVDEVPSVPEARELYGLTLYRLGKWREASGQLEAFVELTRGSVEQHPVLEDCQRALGRHAKVDQLWDELRTASPSAELVTEGRIVAAGSLADRGELSKAISLLAKGFKFPKAPAEHHLRRAYALADLYERSGDLPQARQLFGRLLRAAPDFVDVADRVDSLD